MPVPRWSGWLLLLLGLAAAGWGLARLEQGTSCIPPTALGCSAEGRPGQPGPTDTLGLGLVAAAALLGGAGLLVGTLRGPQAAQLAPSASPDPPTPKRL